MTLVRAEVFYDLHDSEEVTLHVKNRGDGWLVFQLDGDAEAASRTIRLDLGGVVDLQNELMAFEQWCSENLNEEGDLPK